MKETEITCLSRIYLGIYLCVGHHNTNTGQKESDTDVFSLDYWL